MADVTSFEDGGKVIQFCTPSDVCEWRVNTLLSKEPLTIKWIRTFTPEDIFWDIGANIGIYTMFASVVMGTPTYAFEPHHLNYAVLNDTIKLNKVDTIVRAYCMGIGNKMKMGTLSQLSEHVGSSAHTIGGRFTTTFFQGCVINSIDKLVRIGLPVPTKLKIDIDGLEHLVISGAINTLPKIQSVLVELNINKEEHDTVFKTMHSLGFLHNIEDRRVTESGKHAGNGEFLFYNTNVK